MKSVPSTRVEETPKASTVRVRHQVKRMIAAWRAAGRGDAREALHEHPELLADRSAVLDLALEDFCLRRDRGEALGPETFRERFDSLGFDLARSIERLVEVEQIVERESLSRPCSAWPEVGEELGHLLVLEELGRGGLARVYLCRERSVGDRLVVAKLSARETEEAHRLGRLRHPNIVEVLSAQRHPQGEGSLICMPYYGRYTLWHLMTWLSQQETLDVGKAYASWVVDPHLAPADPSERFQRCGRLQLLAELFGDVCKGIAYAHAEGIVHGDIKPSNVLLTTAGAKLIDFNLSRRVSIDDRWVGGTLPYLAPETLEAYASSSEPPTEDEAQAADIFALGITMAEVVTGVRPMAGSATASTEELRSEVVFPAQLRLVDRACAELPAGHALTDLIRQCTREKPNERPTATELVISLSAACSPDDKRPSPTVRLTRRAVVASLTVAGAAWAGQRLWSEHYDPHTQLREGVRRLKEGRYDQACRLLSRIPETHTLGRNARYSLSWALMLAGRYSEASPILDQLASSKRDDWVEMSIGYWYAVQHEFDAGVACYKRVTGKQRGARATLNNHGCCLWLASGGTLPEDERRNLGYSKLMLADSGGKDAVSVRRNLALLITHDLLSRPHLVTERMADHAARALVLGVPTREDLLVAARLFGAMASLGTSRSLECRQTLTALLDLEASPSSQTWELDPAFKEMRGDPSLDRRVGVSPRRLTTPEIEILAHPGWIPEDRFLVG